MSRSTYFTDLSPYRVYIVTLPHGTNARKLMTELVEEVQQLQNEVKRMECIAANCPDSWSKDMLRWHITGDFPTIVGDTDYPEDCL